MDEHEVALIEALRDAYEAFNRGDFDAVVSLAHPEVEYVRPGVEGSLKGAEAVRAWMEPDAFDTQKVEALDLEVNGNKVLIRQRTFARGAGSGIELDTESWAVLTLEQGLVTRAEVFLLDDEDEARRAARMAE
jgi:ketosteroid isomerase-like protein